MCKGRVAVLAAIIAVQGLFLGATAGSAFGSAKTVTNGAIKVVVYGDGEGVGSNIVITGAIGDGGYADSIDANGQLDPANNTEVHLALSQGTFDLNVQSVNKAIQKAFGNFQPNTTTCSGTVSTGALPLKIVQGSGTGAYSGITGTVTVTLTIGEVGVKYTSGKHKGQCNNSNDSPSAFSAMLVTGSGTVSY